MRKVLIGLGVMVLLLAVGFAGAQDDEPQIVLPVLVEGETLSGEFETTADAQIFGFNGSEGDVVTITFETTTDEFFDPALVLLGEAGQVIAFNDDSASGDLAPLSSELAEIELPYSGSYYILATTVAGLRDSSGADDSGAPYTFDLTASGFTVPEDMDTESLRYAGIDVEYGQSGSLEITEDEPVFYVTFNGEEGDVVDIRTVVGSAEGEVGDTLLYLFDSTGRRIADNDDSDGFAAELLDIELPADGQYLLFATSYGFNDVEAAAGLFNVGTFGLSIDAE